MFLGARRHSCLSSTVEIPVEYRYFTLLFIYFMFLFIYIFHIPHTGITNFLI